MSGAIQALKISELVNYYENPRHAIGSSEVDTLKNFLMRLAFSICLIWLRMCKEMGC